VPAYVYYCATLLEVFTDDLTEERLGGALDATTAGSFENLASARQLLATNPNLAWATLLKFRKAWDLTAVEYPFA
jgi:hypothetical protein